MFGVIHYEQTTSHRRQDRDIVFQNTRHLPLHKLWKVLAKRLETKDEQGFLSPHLKSVHETGLSALNKMLIQSKTAQYHACPRFRNRQSLRGYAYPLKLLILNERASSWPPHHIGLSNAYSRTECYVDHAQLLIGGGHGDVGHWTGHPECNGFSWKVAEYWNVLVICLSSK